MSDTAKPEDWDRLMRRMEETGRVLVVRYLEACMEARVREAQWFRELRQRVEQGKKAE